MQARIVPLIVEYDAFWTRYFYRLHKLQQKHEQFVQVRAARWLQLAMRSTPLHGMAVAALS